MFRLAAEKSKDIKKKNRTKDDDDESFEFEEDFFNCDRNSYEMVTLQWIARIMSISGNSFSEFNAMMDTDIVELYEYYSVRMALYVME